MSLLALTLGLVALVEPVAGGRRPGAGEAPVPASGDALGQALEVLEGLEVALWAESPELFNPTAIDVDARGRLWVAEAVNYRKWEGRNPGREHAAGDRVVILEDSDGDGLCDLSKVFVQDPDLVAPLGIAVMGARVVVSCSPSVFVYTDTDGDDRADRREVLLTGFGGVDHDHGVHSLVAGPDGAWYGNAGNAGPHVVTDRAGWTLRAGSYYSGGGPLPVDNRPALVSDDGRVWTGGLVFSLQPNGSALRVLAHNFRNSYEVALDSFGNLFQSDNDDDGNRSCRTLWVMEGGNYGFFSEDGSRSWQADRRPGQSIQTAHWHREDPGVAPAGTINGAGGPTGVAVYEATWPGMLEQLDGAVLNADAGAGVVYAHLPRRVGAGIELEPRTLIGRRSGEEGEGARWFRPSDVALSTDGSIFVADWYDPGVGGHMAGDRAAYGRILRLSAPGASSAPVAVALGSAEELVAALRSPAVNVRGEALRRIGELPKTPDLSPLLGSRSPRLRARGTYAYALSSAEIGRAQDEDPDVRIATLRAMRARSALTGDPLGWLGLARRLFDDTSKAVRAEVALSLRDVPSEVALPMLVYIARSYPVGDRSYLEAFGSGARGRESELYDELLGRVPDALAWTPAQADLAWRLHPAQAVPALRERALAPQLDSEARRRATDALAFIPTRAAGEAMLDVAVAGPEEGRELARCWLEQRDASAWQAHALLEQLERGGLERAELVYSSGVLRSGLVEIDVDVRAAERLWLVVRDAGDGNACDWADWIEPRFEGAGPGVPLSGLEWLEAQAAWGSVQRGRNCVGDPLRVGMQTFADGIGTHALSTLSLEVPEGAQRLRSQAGPDQGGTSQGGTSLVFEVYLERPESRAALVAWCARLRDPEAPEEVRADAIRALSSNPEGGLILIRMAAAGELDARQVALCGETIFANPDLSVRALASEWFQRPGYEQSDLPSIAELVTRPGDAARGRALFLEERAQCARCHVFQGRGGSIGPDLSAIRDKLDAGGLFDAILNPSAGIAHGYDTWLIETRSGVLHSGFILADGKQLILKDTQGKRRAIPADEIAARHPQKLSTMPEGVALGLDAQELVDLVALLREDPARPPTFGAELELFDGASLAGWVAVSSDPAVPPEAVWSVRDGVLVCTGQPVGYLRTEATFTNYELSLEWRFDPAQGPGNSGVLLRQVGPDKVWPRSIEAQLQHGHAGDIWNIDQFPMWTDPTRLAGRRTPKRTLSSERPIGEWNRYVITLDGGSLTLEVNGVVQNEATWCEQVAGAICLQSEGAAIQFRNIRLRPIL